MQQQVPPDAVSLTEAAAVLGVHKSTLSRQAGKLFPRYDVDGKVLISVAEAERGRAQLDPAKQLGRGQPVDTLPFPRVVGSVDRKRAADAERAEIELAKLRGDLVDRHAVANAVDAAAQALLQGLASRRRPLAERLAAMTDVAGIAALLEEEDRQLLARMADEFDRADDVDAVA